MRYLIAFFQFWYHFVVGDDWTIAASVAIGLLLTFGLVQSGIAAWWLMPLVSILVLTWRVLRTAG